MHSSTPVVNSRSAFIQSRLRDASKDSVLGAVLGPQRLHITIQDTLSAHGIKAGQVAVITAGWQDLEDEDAELVEAIAPRKAINLSLHARCDAIFQEDPELFRAHRAKQDQLRDLQRVYRIRLDHALETTRAILTLDTVEAPLLDPELSSAFDFVRQLDAHHLSRIDTLQDRFERDISLATRPAVARHRREIADILVDCKAVLIAGGHVASLLNRMRLLHIAPLLQTLPIFAWSAGAMVTSDLVVLFHDHPPQGRGNAEVLAHGLGLFRHLIFLPHAKRRLTTNDPIRVSQLTRRFPSCLCVPLDFGNGLHFQPNGIAALPASRALTLEGQISPLTPPKESP